MHVKSLQGGCTAVNGRRIWLQLSHELLLLMLVAYMYHVTRINQIRPPLLALGLRWGRAWTSPTSRDLHGQSHAKAVTGSRRILLYMQCRLLLSAYQNFILAGSQSMKKESEK